MTKLIDDNREILHQLGTESRIIYVEKQEIISLHSRVIKEFKGAEGIRDLGLLESALSKPMNLSVYEDESDPVKLACSLSYGIISNHPFNDGNKRAGFLALALFLNKNNVDFNCDKNAKLNLIRNVASGNVTVEQFAEEVQSLLDEANKSKLEGHLKGPK